MGWFFRILGAGNGTESGNIKVPDIQGLWDMIKNGQLKVGNKIPIKKGFFGRDDTFKKRVDYVFREIAELLDYLNSIRTAGATSFVDDSDWYNFGGGIVV